MLKAQVIEARGAHANGIAANVNDGLQKCFGQHHAVPVRSVLHEGAWSAILPIIDGNVVFNPWMSGIPEGMRGFVDLDGIYLFMAISSLFFALT